jgi:pimeloyl-ACP methyl ester carboxylesterase
LAVRENRTSDKSRLISLRVVVVRAPDANRVADPIFFLAGGPGQAATEFLREPSIVRGPERDRRDVVLADQRGTGGSNGLHCRFYGPPTDPQSYFDAFLPLAKVRACKAALEPHADLAQYTTDASVEDLEEIRAALGYEQINLVGGSYGTRLAMEYVRRYEPRVRAVILDGAVPPRMNAPDGFGHLAGGALEGILDECQATEACAAAFPSIRDKARTVFDRLRRGPVTARVLTPVEKQPAVVTLTRDHVAEAIRYMTYGSRAASSVPLVLHEAFNGNFSPVAQFLLNRRADGTFDGLYLSITCAEDVPFVPPEAAERDDPTYLGGYRVRQQRAACAEWPRGAPRRGGVEPVRSNVPVLLMSGLLDPVTPPSNGDDVARTLPNSLHVRIPHGAHSAAGLQDAGCLAALRREFINQASVKGLDPSCVTHISRPGFVLGR